MIQFELCHVATLYYLKLSSTWYVSKLRDISLLQLSRESGYPHIRHTSRVTYLGRDTDTGPCVRGKDTHKRRTRSILSAVTAS